MSSTIPAALRAAVFARAEGQCEYCLKPQLGFYPHEVDHVIAIKHGGQTTSENLALACFQCNRHKGSDLSSIDPMTGDIAPLFNPRTQQWVDHFLVSEFSIMPQSSAGRVTVALLHLNDHERVQERKALAIF